MVFPGNTAFYRFLTEIYIYADLVSFVSNMKRFSSSEIVTGCYRVGLFTFLYFHDTMTFSQTARLIILHVSKEVHQSRKPHLAN